MKRLRLACAAFAAWLFILFNIERIHEPLNLASFLYVIAAVSGVAIVGIKRLGDVPLQWMVSAPLVVFVALKVWLGHPVMGTALPMTVLETCALGVTVALAHQIAVRLRRLEKASAGMISDHPNRQPVSLWAAQSELYREVRRARKHERPLSVLAVASTGQSVNPEEERLRRELERELLDKYARARIADFLAKEARDHGIVTHCDRHFMVLLPETDRQTSEEIVRRLKSSVESALGLKLNVGVSTFPDEEVTLVGLFQRAEASMRNGTEQDPQSVEKGKAADNKIKRPPASSQAQTALESKSVEPTPSDTVVDLQLSRETVVSPAEVSSVVPK